MSHKKKQVREQFRLEVFKRDRNRCRVCGRKLGDLGVEIIFDLLDAHHVMPREDMPNGGYVKENGITLCKIAPEGVAPCHMKAEEWLKNNEGEPGFDPDSLYRLIGSSLDLALQASEKLNVH
jgi:hypothetical protein